MTKIAPTNQRKLETVGRLAAGITHEINTPMHYVGNNITFLKTAFSDLLALQQEYRRILDDARAGRQISGHVWQTLAAQERQADPDYLQAEIVKAIDQSIEGIQRVTRIVLALKDFSHPALHEYSLADLNQCIDTTVTICRHEWKRVADLDTSLEANLPLVYCCRDDINQALLNLIVNASHAVRTRIDQGGYDRGRITLASSYDEATSRVRLAISDNGCGIAAQRLFTPGFTTKPAGVGTGQGLSFVRQIIEERHHGTVTFSSAVGKGTTFTLELPLRPETESETGTPGAE